MRMTDNTLMRPPFHSSPPQLSVKSDGLSSRFLFSSCSAAARQRYRREHIVAFRRFTETDAKLHLVVGCVRLKTCLVAAWICWVSLEFADLRLHTSAVSSILRDGHQQCRQTTGPHAACALHQGGCTVLSTDHTCMRAPKG